MDGRVTDTGRARGRARLGGAAVRYLATLALAVLAVWAWESPMVLPLRLLVVLFHEGAHALAAWGTGGEVVELAIDLSEAGHTTWRGGVPLVVLNAGYLGSLAAGLALVGVPTHAARAACVCLGLLLGALVSLMPLGAGLLYAVTSAAGLVLLGWKGDPWACRWTLRAVGVFAVLYALVDMHADAGLGDAALLAERTGVPALAWTGLWLVLGAAGTWALRHRLIEGGEPPGPPRRRRAV